MWMINNEYKNNNAKGNLLNALSRRLLSLPTPKKELISGKNCGFEQVKQTHKSNYVPLRFWVRDFREHKYFIS